MKRYFWGLILVLLLLGCGTKTVYDVGILVGVDQNMAVVRSFIAEMEKLGYSEGQNIVYDIQDGKSDAELMAKICRDFNDRKVDLIVSITHGASMAAKAATAESGIPVVFSYAVTSRGGLVNTIAEPGGNITGVRYPIPDMAIKRLEFMLTIDPDLSTILLPLKNGYPPAMIVVNGLQEIAGQENLQLVMAPFSSLDEMESYFQERLFLPEKIDAVLVLPEPFAYSERGWNLLKEFSFRENVPIAANSFHMTRDGALFSYTNIDEEMGELAAPLVKKIFDGADPGQIPVVTPKIYLHLNQLRASELNLEFPAEMLKLAAEIIENE